MTSGNRPFLRNCWQVAAFAHELYVDFIARRLLDEPVLLFRTSDGAIAALDDHCPHRVVPLSIGKRVGDAVQCGYHGTVVAADGRCLRIPGQTHIPNNSATRTYPALERFDLIWIWMGDPALADEALVPNLFWMDDPQWTAAKGYIHMEADYRLVTDNLLDLSHETYIHASSLGNREEESIADFPATVTIEDGRIVHARRDMAGIEAPPAWVAASATAGTIDRLQIASYQPPGINMTEAGHRPHGHDGDYMTFGRVMHLLTPETATTTHYFFALARNYQIEDPALTQLIVDSTLSTFSEDKFVLELQQKALTERGDDRVPSMPIALDGAAIQGRRLLAAALQRERDDPKTVVVPFPIVPEIDHHKREPAQAR
jgi:phenylpropionate dioxygenase-like ring-hydroxylating dioxygenase large terminal subunit